MAETMMMFLGFLVLGLAEAFAVGFIGGWLNRNSTGRHAMPNRRDWIGMGLFTMLCMSPLMLGLACAFAGC